MVKAKAEQKRLMTDARVGQILMQDQLMTEIDASRANNEELCKTNKDLRKSLQQYGQRFARERRLNALQRGRSKQFSQAIMDEPVPSHYITPKIVFTGVEDPKNHLAMFKPR